MRPYVICHMTTSIDGKVTGNFLFREECIPATEEYYRLNREIPAQGFACGRVTMEESFTGGWYPELSNYENKKISREDYIANANASRYAVAFERAGFIDELSLVQSSVIADADSKPLFLDSVLAEYHLKEAKVVSENVLWLRYLKN